jgi:hypothetical protein
LLLLLLFDCEVKVEALYFSKERKDKEKKNRKREGVDGSGSSRLVVAGIGTLKSSALFGSPILW